jgi:hypothetical protein
MVRRAPYAHSTYVWMLKMVNLFRHQKISRFEGNRTPLPDTGRFSRLFAHHEGNLAHKWVSYFPVYDRVLDRFAEGFVTAGGERRPLRFLEIGVSMGGSLELWRKFFGPEAVIYGIDVDPRCASVAREDLHVRIGSQSDPAFLADVVEAMGGVDVVLDDGSHECGDQRASFDALFPLLSEGGVYLVEDVYTSYWMTRGGGLRRPGSFVELAKGLVDGMNRWHYRLPVGRRARMAMSDVHSVQFFEAMVVIEKGHRERPDSRKVGTAPF